MEIVFLQVFRRARMRFFSHLPVLAALASTIAPSAAQPQKQLARSPRIQSAKSVYFEDKTGVDAVGNKALAQLKRWGRFQIVKDRKQADLIFILSADPYKGGYIIALADRHSRERSHRGGPRSQLRQAGSSALRISDCAEP